MRKTKFRTGKLKAYAQKKATRFVHAASLAAVVELKDIDDPGDQDIFVKPPEINGDSVTAATGISSPYAVISEFGTPTREPKAYVSKLATDPTRRSRILAKAAQSLKT